MPDISTINTGSVIRASWLNSIVGTLNTLVSGTGINKQSDLLPSVAQRYYQILHHGAAGAVAVKRGERTKDGELIRPLSVVQFQDRNPQDWYRVNHAISRGISNVGITAEFLDEMGYVFNDGIAVVAYDTNHTPVRNMGGGIGLTDALWPGDRLGSYAVYPDAINSPDDFNAVWDPLGPLLVLFTFEGNVATTTDGDGWPEQAMLDSSTWGAVVGKDIRLALVTLSNKERGDPVLITDGLTFKAPAYTIIVRGGIDFSESVGVGQVVHSVEV